MFHVLAGETIYDFDSYIEARRFAQRSDGVFVDPNGREAHEPTHLEPLSVRFWLERHPNRPMRGISLG